jgi:broad specificity phosphatase PhoE
VANRRFTSRLTFLCHGSTSATRSTAFSLDEPLEPAALAAASSLADQLDRPSGEQTLIGPTLRCRQTAEQLKLAATIDPGLTDWNLGSWAGRTLAEVSAEAPDSVQAWLTDPTAEPPGGESLISLIERVGTWLDAAASRPPRVLAITHPAVVRSAIVHTLRAPADSFWRIDIAPLAVVEVRGQPGRWSLVP